MKIVGLGLVMFVLACSCSKTENERVYTKEEMQIITDSARAANIKAANIAAQKDLEIRKAIELKSRMDSIKNADRKK